MKHSPMLFFIITCVFLSSCIKVDINHEIQSNGSSYMEYEVNMAWYIEYIKSLEDLPSSETEVDLDNIDLCQQAIETSDIPEWFVCKQVSPTAVVLSWNINLLENQTVAINGEKMTVDILKMSEQIIGNNDSSIEEVWFDDQQVIELEQLWFTSNYKLISPGKITKLYLNGDEYNTASWQNTSPIGEVNENVFSLDLLNTQDIEELIIEISLSTQDTAQQISDKSPWNFKTLTPSQIQRVRSILSGVKNRDTLIKLDKAIKKRYIIAKPWNQGIKNILSDLQLLVAERLQSF